jgi:hypothetical protein
VSHTDMLSGFDSFSGWKYCLSRVRHGEPVGQLDCTLMSVYSNTTNVLILPTRATCFGRLQTFACVKNIFYICKTS